MKMIKPSLPSTLQNNASLAHCLKAAEQEDIVQGMLFEGETMQGFSLAKLELRKCRLVGCRLVDCHFEQLQLIDVELEHCDLSNSNFTGSVFHRSQLSNCKLLGVNLTNSFARNVSFTSCICDYTIFDKSDYKNVYFQECSLLESTLTRCRLDLVLERCDLSGSQLYDTMLSGIDLSSCHIDRIRLSLRELKGAKVSPDQTAQLAHLLGVELVIMK